ncbi:hypothetical protein B0H19DRAFT_1262739 [Mycena capillaripes]|nr:hypothetical protein B0H19DRAFT_1262739 [Mycena capillaripes]
MRIYDDRLFSTMKTFINARADHLTQIIIDDSAQTDAYLTHIIAVLKAGACPNCRPLRYLGPLLIVVNGAAAPTLIPYSALARRLGPALVRVEQLLQSLSRRLPAFRHLFQHPSTTVHSPPHSDTRPRTPWGAAHRRKSRRRALLYIFGAALEPQQQALTSFIPGRLEPIDSAPLRRQSGSNANATRSTADPDYLGFQVKKDAMSTWARIAVFRQLRYPSTLQFKTAKDGLDLMPVAPGKYIYLPLRSTVNCGPPKRARCDDVAGCLILELV